MAKYFTKKNQNDFIKFINSEFKNNLEKEYFFAKNLEPILNKMIDSISYKYFKSNYFNENIKNLRIEIISHILENLNKFDADKGKMYSYVSTIIKNYLINLNKKNYKNLISSVYITNENENDDDIEYYNIQIPDEYYAYKENENNYKLFIKYLVFYLNKNKERYCKTITDEKVYDAFIYFLENFESISILNKKAIFIIIKDISGVNKTYNISKIINKIKKDYKKIMESYNVNCL